MSCLYCPTDHFQTQSVYVFCHGFSIIYIKRERMDPSQAQSDSANDSHSLEQVDEKDAAKSAAPEAAVASASGSKPETKDGVVDATGGESASPAPAPKKTNPLKRFWQ